MPFFTNREAILAAAFMAECLISLSLSGVPGWQKMKCFSEAEPALIDYCDLLAGESKGKPPGFAMVAEARMNRGLVP